MAICVKKVVCKAWLAVKSSLELRSQYSEARKAAASKVKLFKAGARPAYFKGWVLKKS